MEELKAARGETERTRQELGAVDVKPGEVEGMVLGTGTGAGEVEGAKNEVAGAKSRAMEKRKRELEERRKLVDAKRRKVTKGSSNSQSSDAPASAPTLVQVDGSARAMPSDPFAALEGQAVSRRGKANQAEPDRVSASSTITAADDFLASLEKDMTSQMGKRNGLF